MKIAVFEFVKLYWSQIHCEINTVTLYLICLLHECDTNCYKKKMRNKRMEKKIYIYDINQQTK